MRSSLRRALGALVAGSAAVGGLVAFAPPSSAATDFCSATTVPVYRAVSPTRGGNDLLTRYQSEARDAANFSYTDYRGVFGNASATAIAGLSPVTRLFNPTTADFIWLVTATEISSAKAVGYQVQKVDFYAPTSSSTCTVAVHRYKKAGHRRNAWDSTERSNLLAQGWVDSGVSFYLKKPSSTTTATPTPKPTATATPTPTPTATATTPATSTTDTFSIGVIGDTQDEIYSSTDTRFPKRTAWLASNKDKLGLKYVIQTGDISSWGWLATNQYANAKKAMTTLDNAGIPWAGAVGNHDTAAVGWNGIAGSTGYGGSAYAMNPECPTRLTAAQCNSNYLVRRTEVHNSYFPLSGIRAVGGAYEAGKADNHWTTFTANNTKWLVLTLELWPRTGVVAWAKSVVASHPDYNVIISTHSYLDGGGSISTSNGGYGSTSPKYLYDQIVSQYSNVKLVFSGHVGTAASRQDTPNGNTVVSYVGNELGKDATLRMLTVNTTTGSVKSTVYNAAFTSVGSTSHTIKVLR